MGGRINISVRYANGEAVSIDTWTNPVPSHLGRLDLLDDETIARAFIDECIKTGSKKTAISLSEYGIIAIDYVTKTIVDHNYYTSLFHNTHDFEIRNTGNAYFDRKTLLLLDAISRGYPVIENHYPDPSVDECVKTRIYDLDEALARNVSFEGALSYCSFYDIDISPWTYHYGDRDDGLKIVRQIGFPTSKKQGLNV